MKTVILQKTKAWSKMFLSGVQVLGLLKKKKKATLHYRWVFFMVGRAAP